VPISQSYPDFSAVFSLHVESLGGDMDTTAGPRRSNFMPDISLCRLDFRPEQAKAVRAANSDQDFKAALDELTVMPKGYFNEPEMGSVGTGKRQCATIPRRETVAILGGWEWVSSGAGHDYQSSHWDY
jgi:hypothetical protein